MGSITNILIASKYGHLPTPIPYCSVIRISSVESRIIQPGNASPMNSGVHPQDHKLHGKEYILRLFDHTHPTAAFLISIMIPNYNAWTIIILYIR